MCKLKCAVHVHVRCWTYVVVIEVQHGRVGGGSDGGLSPRVTATTTTMIRNSINNNRHKHNNNMVNQRGRVGAQHIFDLSLIHI